nr:helix-turn-helix transcriptional regulator [Microbacterium sp. 77mftsu3.1]
MRRKADYTWNLAELMARNSMHNSTDLAPHLVNRGIDLSPAQIWRLVTQRPERLSLPLLAALCDIFNCSPAELISVHSEDASTIRKAVNEVANLRSTPGKARPRRARVLRDDVE